MYVLGITRLIQLKGQNGHSPHNEPIRLIAYKLNHNKTDFKYESDTIANCTNRHNNIWHSCYGSESAHTLANNSQNDITHRRHTYRTSNHFRWMASV